MIGGRTFGSDTVNEFEHEYTKDLLTFYKTHIYEKYRSRKLLEMTCIVDYLFVYSCRAAIR